jgi:hypothetical protein
MSKNISKLWGLERLKLVSVIRSILPQSLSWFIENGTLLGAYRTNFYPLITD